MKDKGISRNIGKATSRKPGEGPGLGHVSRVAPGAVQGEVAPKGERRRRKVISEEELAHQERRERQSHAIVVRWTMIFALIGVAVLALFAMFWLMPMLEKRKQVATGRDKVVYEAIEKPVDTVPGENESIRIAQRALEAKTPAEVEKWIRPDTATSDEVMEFIVGLRGKEGEIKRYEWMPRLDTSREDISGVVVFYEKDGKISNRLALLIPDEDGRWKMDFPAFARLSVPSWETFLGEDGASALVRVYVAKDQYYNGPFAEQEGWRCFGIASPDVPELMYGYCQMDSPQHRALEELLGGASKARVVLGIEKVEGASDRQFRIKRVMAQDWAVREKAADD